ncbi:MAG: hypothetical protein LBP56_00905 [Odoribacteraceae bacterium]|jgi:hypothetical protein|nr:hypothetical protein [Odoribacteraceae bacterium]
MKTRYTLALAALLLASSCVEDTGNYTYEAPDAVAPVILSGLEASYEAISLEQLVIDPEMKEDGDHFEYAWYAYPINHTAIPYDTIGRARKLDYTVTIPSGTYTLIFKATDKRHGTSVYQRTQLSVSSIFGKGYYVNKSENGRGDVDFIDRNGTLHPNLLKQVNGDDLPGTAVRSAYVSNKYYYETTDAAGVTTRLLAQPAFLFCTDQDMRVYHGDNMNLLKSWDEAFLEVPAVKRPQGVWATGGGFMLMNDNALHFIHNNGYTVGQFGYHFPSGDYRYAAQAAIGSSGCCVFDENAGTFLGYYPAHNTPYTDVYPAYVGHNYVNQELLWLGSRHFYDISSTNAYAIIRDKGDDAVRVFTLWPHYIQSNLFVFETEYLINPGIGIGDGKVFTCHGGGNVSTISAGHPVIYYSTGDNRVHYYNLANQIERRDAVTLPADERVVYIHHAYDYYYQVNIFSILAEKNGNWKLYTHDMVGSTPDIQATPAATYSGTGTPVNLIYRHPDTKLTY